MTDGPIDCRAGDPRDRPRLEDPAVFNRAPKPTVGEDQTMSSLTNKLRTVHATGEASRCMGEAADRIEALEAALHKANCQAADYAMMAGNSRAMNECLESALARIYDHCWGADTRNESEARRRFNAIMKEVSHAMGDRVIAREVLVVRMDASEAPDAE